MRKLVLIMMVFIFFSTAKLKWGNKYVWIVTMPDVPNKLSKESNTNEREI